MRIYQPLCVALLALSASTGSVAAVSDTTAGKLQEAGDRVTIDESISLNNNPGWETPDLPYARLLASSSATAAPHWSSARHVALAPPRPMTAAPAQQASVPAPVPEASMYSMLLVGLGLVALSLHGEKQEKFDN